MRRGQVRVTLYPLEAGHYTGIFLNGAVPTAVTQRDIAHFIRKLSFWSGYPVVLALSVDSATAGWCEWWTAQCADIAEHHLELLYEGTIGADVR